MKSLFDDIMIEISTFCPHLNTGNILDIATGSFINGINGNMVLNGGLGLTNASVGRSQTQKSTTTLSHVINAFARLYGSNLIVYDTEKALSEERIFSLCDIPLTDEQKNNVKLVTPDNYTLEEMHALVENIVETKINNKKQYTMEMPILAKNGKTSLKILKPTFIVYDSWSKASTSKFFEMLTSKLDTKSDEFSLKKSITDSASNTAFMKEGLYKKKMIGMLASFAEKASIYFFFTSHVGDKIEMDPYSTTPKTLQFMRNADKTKDTGSNFLFLMNNLLDCRGSKTLLDNERKGPLYPSSKYNFGKDEIQEISQVLARCKNNASGPAIPCIISQSKGISSGLTYYHYLKENKYYGFEGNPRSHKLYLKDDINVSRTTIYDLCYTNKEFARALEITGISLYIQNNWYFDKTTSLFGKNVKEVAKRLKEKKLLDKILKSRGWLTNIHKDNPHNKIEYLSYMDILKLAFN